MLTQTGSHNTGRSHPCTARVRTTQTLRERMQTSPFRVPRLGTAAFERLAPPQGSLRNPATSPNPDLRLRDLGLGEWRGGKILYVLFQCRRTLFEIMILIFNITPKTRFFPPRKPEYCPSSKITDSVDEGSEHLNTHVDLVYDKRYPFLLRERKKSFIQ